ncbi:MAG: hypothetical protein JWP01_815 [Myxococcales bacterium]|nr:hypothetical protein [Myxococcales bacterium]
MVLTQSAGLRSSDRTRDRRCPCLGPGEHLLLGDGVLEERREDQVASSRDALHASIPTRTPTQTAGSSCGSSCVQAARSSIRMVPPALRPTLRLFPHDASPFADQDARIKRRYVL